MKNYSNNHRFLLFVFLVLGLAACTPQTTEPDALTIPTVAVAPTQEPTNTPIVLPTAVAVWATQTAVPTETKTARPTDTPATATIAPSPTAQPEPSNDNQQDRPSSYTVVGVDSDDVLNIRSGPGVDNEIVGELPHNGTGIELLGEDVLINNAPWREIQYEAITGWVNRTFLALQYGELNDSAPAASAIITALKNQDYETLATYVHPENGVRVSPNTYVTDDHLVFNAAQVANWGNDTTIYEWGIQDGEGGPIKLTFAEYNQRYLYNVDYVRPHSIGFNTFIGSGNRINNIPEFYPDAPFVEYHFPGFEPDFGGLDWASLRLIMEKVDGEWKLIGIVHSEWTI